MAKNKITEDENNDHDANEDDRDDGDVDYEDN